MSTTSETQTIDAFLETFQPLYQLAQADDTERAKISENPLEALEALGIFVEEHFREPVIQGLQAVVNALGGNGEAQTTDGTALSSLKQPALRELPAMLKSLGSKTNLEAQTDAPSTKRGNSGVRFLIKPWGIALALDTSAIGKVKGGLLSTKAISDAVASQAGALGTSAVPQLLVVAILAKVFSFYLAVNHVLIGAMDRGKGVYLTLTWLHVLLLLPPLYSPLGAIPVPIPIP